jgi:hypothetical protein
MTDGNGSYLLKVAIGMSTLAVGGLLTGLVQWGALGAEVARAKEDVASVESDVSAIKDDVQEIREEQKVNTYILRGIEKKLQWVVGPPIDQE